MFTRLNRKRKGITGIETAIILTAFVITASAFSFVILNVGFLTSEKVQTTVINSMKESSSSLIADAGVTGYFSNTTTANQDEVYLEEIIFYIKTAQGHEPIDCGDDSLVMTFTNIRGHTVIYSDSAVNGSITTIETITGDGDSLLEIGEKMQVHIDLRQVNVTDVKPQPASHLDIYGKPYESVRIEIRPIVGAVLTLEKEIPAVNAPVMTLR